MCSLPVSFVAAGRRAASVVFVAAPIAAIAQSTAAPQRLEPVSVTATRGLVPLVDLLADVTVIGPEEIARSGMQSLTELLQRQPGVEIIQNGGPQSVSSVLLRGASRGQTLVLIDGVRLASSTAGATSFEAIPLDAIDHIEILRGPASSLYGADAIGGVVQIFTRKGAQGLAASASAGYGTYQTWKGNGAVSGSVGPVQWSLQAGAKESNGFNAFVDPANPLVYNPDRDGYTNQNVSAFAALPWAEGQQLSGQFFHSRLNAQYDGGLGFDDRTITTVETWRVASRNRLAPFWVWQLSAGEGSDDSVTHSAYGDFLYNTVQRQYTWQNEFTLPAGMLTAGYDRLEERVSTNAGFPVTERNTDSVFGIYQLAAGPHALQANLRHDDSSQYGGQTTGAIAYGLRVAPWLRLTAAYSTGFKAPSFNDLYFPLFSNPDLAPETSHNVEAGAYFSGKAFGGTWEARAIGYRNRVGQLIALQCDVSFNCIPYNVASALLEGATFGLEGRFGATTIAASLDLANPIDRQSGLLLPRRAREHGALSVAHAMGPLRLGVELVASSSRFDDPSNSRRMGGYTVVNVTAEWDVARGLTAFVRADDVFDRDYELAAHYATGGATVFGGLRWRL